MTMSVEITDERTTAALSSWDEWKERCALGLCTEGVQSDLKRFAGHHGKRYVFRYAHKVGAPRTMAPPSAENMWHLFETHLTVRDNRQGKKYKDWLFARASGNKASRVEAVNAGATLLLRDVVREHLCREYSPEHVISMNTPLEGKGSGLTIEDLLPGSIDTADEVARREFQSLADSHANEFLGGMNQREKVALLARELGIPSTHPVIVKLADCQKSMLSEVYQASVLKMSEQLKEQYAEEDEETVRILMVMTFETVNQNLRESMTTEGSLKELLALEREQ